MHELVAENPRRAHVFERLGVPYCCDNLTTLPMACAQRGLDSAEVLEELRACDSSSSPTQGLSGEEKRRWLLSALERAGNLVDRVASHHGQPFPELWQLETLFAQCRADLEKHLTGEAQEFPRLQAALDAVCSSAAKIAPATACNTYRVMEDALRELRDEVMSHPQPA